MFFDLYQIVGLLNLWPKENLVHWVYIIVGQKLKKRAFKFYTTPFESCIFQFLNILKLLFLYYTFPLSCYSTRESHLFLYSICINSVIDFFRLHNSSEVGLMCRCIFSYFLLSFCFMNNLFQKKNTDKCIQNSYSGSFYFSYGMIILEHNFPPRIGVP